MICGDMLAAKVMMDMRVEEAQRAARWRKLKHRAGTRLWARVQRGVYQMLSSLGCRLVTLGKRLERYGLSGQSLQ